MEDLKALLAVARDLTEQNKPDVELMQELLDTLPLFNFDMPTRLAIAHAQKVSAASLDGSGIHALVAQCALARVVALLERRVTVARAFAVS